MNHRLWLYHVGPIQECDLEINDFTVLTGPQSSGKSTVAKAVSAIAKYIAKPSRMMIAAIDNRLPASI